MFYGSKISAMPPKLRSDDGRNTVIRPLAYVSEKDIEDYAAIREYPIIPCNLCGSQETLQRQAIKEMLTAWDKKTPGRVENIFRSLQNVRPSQLADRDLFDFAGLGNANSDQASRPSTTDWLLGAGVAASEIAPTPDTARSTQTPRKSIPFPVEVIHG